MVRSLCIMLALALAHPAHSRDVWSVRQASNWYAAQPWLIGVNYVPATAVNQLEMWQADSFDPATIDRELGWARGMGMNSVRVFLHDLPYSQDAKGFLDRVDRFLAIADKHGIRTILVLFDSCWDPDPVAGPQRPPIPGVHNSRWVQSPGRIGLTDPAQEPQLKAYVDGVVRRFARDPRVLLWDVWNEPDSPGGAAYQPIPDKERRVEALMVKAFAWVREHDPVQPTTASLFQTDSWAKGRMRSIERAQIAESDVLSFHDYRWPEDFEANVRVLQAYGRPVLATEYLARGAGSTFDTILPIAKRMNVGVWSWGFVDGKTQTRLPWDSWKRPYVGEEPTVWFHDIVKTDGTPYRPAETAMIRRYADAPKGELPGN